MPSLHENHSCCLLICSKFTHESIYPHKSQSLSYILPLYFWVLVLAHHFSMLSLYSNLVNIVCQTVVLTPDNVFGQEYVTFILSLTRLWFINSIDVKTYLNSNQQDAI